MLSMVSKGSSASEPSTGQGNPPKVASSTAKGVASSTHKSKEAKPTVATAAPVMSEAERREQQARVERLKAARLKEKQEAAAAKAKGREKGKAATSSSRPKTTTTNKPKTNTTKKSKPRVPEYTEPASSPKKKLSFKEIMQQADKVNTDNLKLTVKVRKDSENGKKQQPQSSRANKSQGRARSTPDGDKGPDVKPSTSSRPSPKPSTSPSPPVSKKASSAPAPFSRPMESLVEKQKRRRQRYEDEYDDEDDDGFIVDDEEEEQDLGYNRDEIWKIFGRRRRDDFDEDDDLSDMEATGSQVLEEESRSSLQARLDDKREEEELQRLAMEKARRKKARHR